MNSIHYIYENIFIGGEVKQCTQNKCPMNMLYGCFMDN